MNKTNLLKLIKLAGLTEGVVKRIQPILAEFSGAPRSIKEIIYAPGPKYWGGMRLQEGIALNQLQPAIDQLLVLAHEATHTPNPLKVERRVRKLLEGKGLIGMRSSKRRYIPKFLQSRIGKAQFEWKDYPFRVEMAEEKGVWLTQRQRAIRFMRYIKQKDPQLFEKVKKTILRETREPTLRGAIEKYLPRTRREEIPEIVEKYRSWRK